MEKTNGVPVRRKLLYGLGEITNTLIFTVVPLFLMFYLTDVLGVPAAWAGVISFAGNIFDAVTDPWAGHISDRCKSRLGRRRPFFIIMAVPMALAFGALFSIPTGLDIVTKSVLVTVAYMLLLVLSTFFVVPYLTYGMELDPTYDGRTSVAAWRMVFSIAFGLVGATVPSMIWQSAAVPSQGFMQMAWYLAIPIAIMPLFTFFSGREPQAPHEVDVQKKSNFLREMGLALKNRMFRQGLSIYVLTWLGIGVLQVMLIYYVKYVLQMYEEYAIIAGLIFGVAILCLPLWVAVSNRLDKRKAYIIGAGSFCIVLAFLIMPGEFVRSIVWVLAVLLGVGLSALHVMPSAIIPEAIDAAVAANPELGNGSCNGVMTFINKIGTAAINAVIMAALGAAGYISVAEDDLSVVQPDAAVLAIRIIIVATPILLFLLGIFMCRRFKIGRDGEQK